MLPEILIEEIQSHLLPLSQEIENERLDNLRKMWLVSYQLLLIRHPFPTIYFLQYFYPFLWLAKKRIYVCVKKRETYAHRNLRNISKNKLQDKLLTI